MAFGLGIRFADSFFEQNCFSRLHVDAPVDGGVQEHALSTMMLLQAPIPLAQLPRPLDPDGQTFFNSVYGLSTLKKAKRHEVIAAVDGEAINLYDVRIVLLHTRRFLRS